MSMISYPLLAPQGSAETLTTLRPFIYHLPEAKNRLFFVLLLNLLNLYVKLFHKCILIVFFASKAFSVRIQNHGMCRKTKTRIFADPNID
jgi:hypothetical protein